MKKIKILVVDDEEGIREFLVEYLNLNNFEVLLCSTLKEAIDINKQEKPPLALIDIILPEENGLVLYRELKKDNHDIKVVLMTGFPVEDILEQAMKEGAVSYIFKPFELENILELLKKVSTDLHNNQ
ncbi:MAG: response regulator [Candidatus Coatesbacteria bacterium]|nr:response regulator [Candidatus Coatesbacteria bacterium]